MEPDVTGLILGTFGGMMLAVTFVLALLGGFCVLFGLPKLRETHGGRVVRSLDELVGQRTTFLSPETPRGVCDQLEGGTSRGAGS